MRTIRPIPKRWGVSFSIKQCRNFDIDPQKTLAWLLDEAGFRRFRVMSYWNEIESIKGTYDFSGLDWQLHMIEDKGGKAPAVTLCLGVRQPRWPESHWPDWAWSLSKKERTAALLRFIAAVIDHVQDNPIIVSYQLENEALLKSFGEMPEIIRSRLRAEYRLVKQLDPSRPVIMTTSNSWGLPARKPRPDITGFSYYHTVYNDRLQTYTPSGHSPRIHKFRAWLAAWLLGRKAFIHELQLEPWGPKAIWEIPLSEQDKSMSHEDIKRNVAKAISVGIYPIDLWGGEWWYWRIKVHHDTSIWHAVRQSLR